MDRIVNATDFIRDERVGRHQIQTQQQQQQQHKR